MLALIKLYRWQCSIGVFLLGCSIAASHAEPLRFVFDHAIATAEGISITNGSLTVDSYHSADPNGSFGGYVVNGTNVLSGYYEPALRGAEAEVLAIAGITNSGGLIECEIAGRVSVGTNNNMPFATVGDLQWITNGNSGIQPGRLETGRFFDYPDAGLPPQFKFASSLISFNPLRLLGYTNIVPSFETNICDNVWGTPTNVHSRRVTSSEYPVGCYSAETNCNVAVVSATFPISYCSSVATNYSGSNVFYSYFRPDYSFDTFIRTSVQTNVITNSFMYAPGHGYYKVSGDITLDAEDRMIITGNTAIHITGDLEVIQQSQIIITPGARLRLYCDGLVHVAGNRVTNLSRNPTSFELHALSGCTNITFANDCSLDAIITAPQSKISIIGPGTFILNGALIAKSISIDGSSAAFHYDENLRERGPAFQTFTATASGGGSVAPEYSSYYPGLGGSVIATPSIGWNFCGWIGDSATTNATNGIILLDQQISVHAIFGTPVTTSVVGDGSVVIQPAAAVIPYGTEIMVTANPGPGSYFVGWSGAAEGTSNPLTFAVTNAQPTLTASFAALPFESHALTVQVSGEGHVLKDPDANIFSSGSSVTLTAAPKPGQVFLGWSGSLTTTNNPIVVEMNGSKVLTATFTRHPTLQMQVRPERNLANGGFKLGGWITGPMQKRHLVQVSTNLTTWSSNKMVTNLFGRAQFGIYDTSLTNRLFWRTIEQP